MKKLIAIIILFSTIMYAETVPEAEPDLSDVATGGVLITAILAGTYLVQKKQR